MKIAVTYDNGLIFQHFGHTEQFKVYNVDEGKILSSRVVNTLGAGHGALAGFLKGEGVEVLICGGIGGGARAALAEAGITLYGGVQGSADGAVEALLKGELGYDPAVVSAEIAEDNKLADELGLVLDSDARRTNNSGQAQAGAAANDKGDDNGDGGQADETEDE